MLHHFRFHSTNNLLVNSSNGSLSLLILGAIAAAVSHQLCHLKQDNWWGGPASYMGFPLPCAPGSVGCKPCGQGPPQLRPDGAGQSSGKVIDVQDKDDNDDDDDEENDKSSSDRWVSESGSPGSFCLALWGTLGLWFLCRALQWGSLGGRCVSRLVSDLGIFSVPTLVAD
jgi:hypothetical protein